jgi:hypothetical protein
MKLPLYCFLLMLTCSGCFGNTRTTVRFVNRTSYAIDSIKVGERLWVRTIPLERGQEDSCELTSPRHSYPGAYPVAIYFNGKKRLDACGHYDYGMFSYKEQTLYIFDHKISDKDKAPERPRKFGLIFGNGTDEPIDSFINERNNILRIDEKSPRLYFITMDFDRAARDKQLKISIGGRVKTLDLSFHDFDNWDNTEELVEYNSKGLGPSIPSGRLVPDAPLEIWVEIMNDLPIPADSIRITSPIITAVYNVVQPNQKRIIFDYRRIKDNPLFTVSAMGKTFTVDFRTLDVDNFYSTQKEFRLSEKGLKKGY